MTTTTSFHPGADRYELDFGPCSYARGFAQVDTAQDAWYFGTWTNPDTRRIVSFAEGDLTIRDAESDEEYTAALRELRDWNDERQQWKGIDPGLGETMRARFAALGVADLLH